MQKVQPVARLRLYSKIQGIQGVARDENGNVVNKVIELALEIGRPSAESYIGQMSTMGLVKAEVIRYSELENGEYVDKECPEELSRRISEAIYPERKPSKETSVEELMRKLEEQQKLIQELQNSKALEPKKPKVVKEEKVSKESLPEDLVEEYKAIFGKKPNSRWSEQTVRERIELAR